MFFSTRKELAWFRRQDGSTVRRQNPAFAVNNSCTGILDLAASRLASQLTSRLDECHQAPHCPGVGMAQHAAMGVDRKLATNRGLARGEEGPALAARG